MFLMDCGLGYKLKKTAYKKGTLHPAGINLLNQLEFRWPDETTSVSHGCGYFMGRRYYERWYYYGSRYYRRRYKHRDNCYYGCSWLYNALKIVTSETTSFYMATSIISTSIYLNLAVLFCWNSVILKSTPYWFLKRFPKMLKSQDSKKASISNSYLETTCKAEHCVLEYWTVLGCQIPTQYPTLYSQYKPSCGSQEKSPWSWWGVPGIWSRHQLHQPRSIHLCHQWLFCLQEILRHP